MLTPREVVEPEMPLVPAWSSKLPPRLMSNLSAEPELARKMSCGEGGRGCHTSYEGPHGDKRLHRVTGWPHRFAVGVEVPDSCATAIQGVVDAPCVRHVGTAKPINTSEVQAVWM